MKHPLLLLLAGMTAVLPMRASAELNSVANTSTTGMVASSTIRVVLPIETIEITTTTVSSTESLVAPSSASTTPATAISIAENKTVGTESLLAPIASASSTVYLSTETASPTPIGSAPTSTICLAMIAPYPASGPEWIAVYGLTPSSSERLLQWTFADAQGSVGKVSTSTPLLWDESTQTIRFELKSSRLNNTGDSVYLKNTNGEIHDEYIYTEVEKDQRWVRDSCASPWHIWPLPIVQYTNTTPLRSSSTDKTEAPTEIPVEMVIQSQALPDATPLVVEEELPPVSTATLTQETSAPMPHPSEQRPPPATTVSDQLVTMIVPTAKPPVPDPLANSPQSRKNSAVPLDVKKDTTTTRSVSKPAKTSTKSSTKTSTTQKTTFPAKKSSSPTAKPSIRTIDMNHLIEDPIGFQGVRVRITGIVASTPRLIAANAYIVLNADGKGLFVQGKSSNPSPVRGTLVEVTGVFQWNDTGIILKQQSQDQWKAITPQEPPSSDLPIRLVSLEHPSEEDAWSHVEIEGRVGAVQTSSLDLETDDGYALHVKIPKALGYRASRVQKGDTLRVRGLLDLRGNEPTLIPQILDDLQILERAPLPMAPATTASSSPWLPAGIIAGTLSTGEGLRRLRTWQKKRTEQREFEAFLQGQTQHDG